ncbi:MAG TPA: histidine--tRNA ligase, partial [Verrucomicrobiaceae bacterium]
MPVFQTIKGFRDFFPEDCAMRNYVFEKWRTVAAGRGFVEYEGPALESTDLYRKKSGDEIVHQL